MLRTVAHDAMASLRHAASQGDAALDLALLRVGILAPCDLKPIRSLLTVEDGVLRPLTNRDGHRVIEVTVQGAVVGEIHHDGRVLTFPNRAA